MGTKKNAKATGVDYLSCAISENTKAIECIIKGFLGLSKRIDAIEKALGTLPEPPKTCGKDIGGKPEPWYYGKTSDAVATALITGSRWDIPFAAVAYRRDDSVSVPAVEFRFTLAGCDGANRLACAEESVSCRILDDYARSQLLFDELVGDLKFIRFQRKRDQTPRAEKPVEEHVSAPSYETLCEVIDGLMKLLGHMSDVPERQTNGSAVPPPVPEAAKPAAAKPKARKAPKTVKHKYEVSVSDQKQVCADLRAMSRYDIPENCMIVGQIEYDKKSRRYSFQISFWPANRKSNDYTYEAIQFRVYKNTDDLDSIVARFDKAVKNLRKVKFQEKKHD